jgi:hypothetical protein
MEGILRCPNSLPIIFDKHITMFRGMLFKGEFANNKECTPPHPQVLRHYLSVTEFNSYKIPYFYCYYLRFSCKTLHYTIVINSENSPAAMTFASTVFSDL